MERVRYEQFDGAARIRMDDGTANVLGPAMLSELHQAFGRAEADGVVTILCGREGVFSGGFDLEVMKTGDLQAISDMVIGGFELARRVLAHPRPVVMECSGHAVAMGLFLLLSGDHVLGSREPVSLVANEVSIGMTLPHSAIAILRHRLTPAVFERTAMLSRPLDVATAEMAGALDEVVDAAGLPERADQVAAELAALDETAQLATKARVRAHVLDELDAAIQQDRRDFEDLLAAAAAQRSTSR